MVQTTNYTLQDDFHWNCANKLIANSLLFYFHLSQISTKLSMMAHMNECQNIKKFLNI